MPIGTAMPGMKSGRRRTIRSSINPMDRSTVVSIFPAQIDEIKPTVQPGRFIIPPGSVEFPAILVVGPSSWYRDIDEHEPLLELVNGSVQIAESIVRDYCIGLLGCNMKDSKPGVFWVPGDHTANDILMKFPLEMKRAIDSQKNFYRELVKMADGLWSKTNGNPQVISDEMRRAAKELGAEGKDWMSNFTPGENIRCSACGSFRNPAYPVCPTCKAVVDVDLAAKLNLKFIQ